MGDIAAAYINSYFVFDVVGTFPVLFMFENYNYYWLKLFRCMVHVFRITQPLEILLSRCLKNFSKKRANDLSSFACIIFFTVYLAHLMGCIWIKLGF
jgi:hypothetical protein